MNSLGRASAWLAAGTMLSRVTGLLRTIVLIGVIGSNASAVADAFSIANQLPNSIFGIISVGVLTAVIVPQIVQAAKSEDGGSAFLSKLLTLGTVVLIGTTVIAMLLAPWLVSLQARTIEQQALATAFAYWCLPQILFYGIYALLGETLNARRVFGPFTWAPIVNNIVSIIGFVIIGSIFGTNLVNISMWTPEMVAALGGLTTLGIFAQAAVLLFFWRRTGFHIRVDFSWRGAGLGNLGRVASWTLAMAFIGLAVGFAQTWVANLASGSNASTAVMMNAWLVFMLPYSIIVHSVGTPYFTQLSEHAAAGRDDDVRTDISRSIRTLALLLVGALAGLVAAAIPASRVFTNSTPDAVDAAVVLLAYLVGLLPLAVLFIIQRTFYAYGDTRTPFLFTLMQAVIIVVLLFGTLGLVNAGVLPLSLLAATVALGQGIAGTLQTIVATWLLRRKLGSLPISPWMGAIFRFVLAGIPASLAGWGVFMLFGGADGWTATDKLWGALGTAVIGGVAITVYLVILSLFRVPELALVGRLLRRVLPSK